MKKFKVGDRAKIINVRSSFYDNEVIIVNDEICDGIPLYTVRLDKEGGIWFVFQGEIELVCPNEKFDPEEIL